MDGRDVSKELTGRHVLIMLILFFGVMIIVNVIFTVLAVKSFTGEDVPKSYRQGLEYNRTIDARRSQAELGWTVKTNDFANPDGSRTFLISIQDKENAAIDNLSFTAFLRHPSSKHLDMPLDFTPAGPGRYQAIVRPARGEWILKAETRQPNNKPLRFKQDIWVE